MAEMSSARQKFHEYHEKCRTSSTFQALEVIAKWAEQ